MMCSTAGRPDNDEPTQTATIAPIVYWPWPPMLNSPARKAKATARPTRMSAVVWMSVCCSASAAAARSVPPTHGNSQLSPVPLKMAL